MTNLTGHTQMELDFEPGTLNNGVKSSPLLDFAKGELLELLTSIHETWLRDGMPEPSISDNALCLALGYCPYCSEPIVSPAPFECPTPARHSANLL